MGRLWKILFFSCTISICFSLPGFPHPVESMEKRVLKRLLSKGFAPCGQETRLSRAKWYLHPLSILDKGKKNSGKFLHPLSILDKGKKNSGKFPEKQSLFHGFSKGFFGMLQACKTFFHGFHIPYYYY